MHVKEFCSRHQEGQVGNKILEERSYARLFKRYSAVKNVGSTDVPRPKIPRTGKAKKVYLR